MKKYVYSFSEGSKDMRDLLGGKGANLAEMTKLGMPVPYGFTISTEACTAYYENGGRLPEEVLIQTDEKVKELEKKSGKKFGDINNPLLVSVRSGSRISMPGMMDTILNLGLNDDSVEGLAKLTGNPRFAADSFRRFLQMYGNVVMGIDMRKFDKVFDGVKAEAHVEFDVDLSTDDLNKIIAGYKEIVNYGKEGGFPSNPEDQLNEAVKAVFRSWMNDRAILYRKLNRIPESYGTAVNVQMMVFGNMGETSGTGVAFTRNPATGEKGIFGEFLVNAQGEDVVAGIRTPKPITEMAESFPDVYKEFIDISTNLEQHYTDMQDMEFTVENNKLFMLQTRNGKRTAQAAFKIAVDMVKEGLIDKETAVMRIDPETVDQLLHPRFDEADEKKATVIATGIAASPGAATGRIYFSAEDAENAVKQGEKAILVREETSPEDLAGMVAAEGILTARGGQTSHAAVVARSMGKCCVAGCPTIVVSEDKKLLKAGNREYHEGDYISLNGSKGNVYDGTIKTVKPEFTGDFGTVMEWADEIRTLKIRTNADLPRDAKQAAEFGAEGIGLCRTEHMFFDDDRIPVFRSMIIAETVEERKEALAKLLPLQKQDFKGIYEVMKELPVTIRLLDPPLHEFLPKTDEDAKELADMLNVPVEKIMKKSEELKEFNPMLGLRGCRLAVEYPEIAEMQTRAIMEAAIEVSREHGYKIVPEIMIPLTCCEKEMEYVSDIVKKTANTCLEEMGSDLKYMVGTMIETPRAAVTADEIAATAEFFSFGTNDLTQMSFGFSRDDTGSLINDYVNLGIFEDNIFKTLDQNGVGKLVLMAAKLGRKTRPTIKLGICGEHGGDPRSIEFCYKIGLDYVSCSPFRVPGARIAAAQAVIKNK